MARARTRSSNRSVADHRTNDISLITHLYVTRLFGRYNISIPIKDNCLIITGVNGIGKSSVLNLLYYMISQQWSRMLIYRFESVGIDIAGERVEVSRTDIEAYETQHLRLREFLPRSVLSRFTENFENDIVQSFLASAKPTSAQITEVARKLELPEIFVQRIRRDLTVSGVKPDRLGALLPIEFSIPMRRLRNLIPYHVIYLPTYRRIEKELQAIIPDIDQRLRGQREESTKGVRTSERYTEIVGFGMDDIQAIINEKCSLVNTTTRQSLNRLAGEYLRDVVTGRASSVTVNDSPEITNLDVDRILQRVSEDVLSPTEKEALRVRITIKAGSNTWVQDDGYLLHFLLKMKEVVDETERSEGPIQRFADMCNTKYLYGKKLEFDRQLYKLRVVDNYRNEVDLKDLSSGEKQIVSIFCRLFLGAQDRIVVIIDEPELSLSLDWQTHFLPDILSTNKCAFMAAVTHSPFVFENNLDPCAVDMLQNMSEQ